MIPAEADQQPGWRGLETARRAAAQRGSTSIGTQHVLLALLSWPDEEVLAALRGSRVDHATAVGALEVIVGRGNARPALPLESVTVSPRVVRILHDAARRGDRGVDGHLRDRDVLAALLESDDPAVGQLIVELIDSPRRVLDCAPDLALPAGTHPARHVIESRSLIEYPVDERPEIDRG